MRQIADTIPSEFECLDREACASRVQAHAHGAVSRSVVTKPVEPAVEAEHPVWALVGEDGYKEDVWIAEGIQRLIGRRVVCVQQVASGIGPQGPITIPIGPQGTLMAVFEDGFLIRNLGGKAVFVSAEKTMYLEEQ